MSIHELFPYLRVKNAGKAIEFYTRAFGVTEKYRLTEPSGRIGHCELDFGGTIVMLSEEYPELGFVGPQTIGRTSMSIHLHVDDCDAAIRRAVSEGAELIREPSDALRPPPSRRPRPRPRSLSSPLSPRCGGWKATGSRFVSSAALAVRPSVEIAVRRKILSPQMTGEALPLPGIDTFQRMFFVSLHSTGGLPFAATPVASGPRQRGQFCSDCFWSCAATGPVVSQKTIPQSNMPRFAALPIGFLRSPGEEEVRSSIEPTGVREVSLQKGKAAFLAVESCFRGRSDDFSVPGA